MMRTNHKLMLAAVAAAAIAVSAGAYAQGFGPCGGGGPGAMSWGGGGPGSGPGFMGQRGGYGPGPGAAWGGPRGADPAAGPAANSELKLAYLKNELKLTGAQDAAWNVYEGAVKKQAASMQAFRESMFG